MDKLYEEEYVKELADAIREKSGSTDKMTVSEMADKVSEGIALSDIEGMWDSTHLLVRMPYDVVPAYMFQGANALVFDIPYATKIGYFAFYDAYWCRYIVLRAPQVVTVVDGGLYTLVGGYRATSKICFLVPKDLIDSYKADTTWGQLTSILTKAFDAIEDYTVDGTVDGKLDRSKLDL